MLSEKDRLQPGVEGDTKGQGPKGTPASVRGPIVFVLGAPRSGTSITFLVLRDVFQMRGRGEGHVIPIFNRMLSQYQRYATNFSKRKGALASRLGPGAFRQHTIEFIRAFYRDSYGPGNWIDKTPGAESILAMPLIKEIFPSCKFVILRRTGVEVVESFRKKFSSEFARGCESWATCMKALTTMEGLRRDALELDQFDLANSAPESAARLSSFLDRPELADKVQAYLANHRINQLSKHDWSKRLTPAQAPWTDEERAIFDSICGEQMKAYRYPL